MRSEDGGSGWDFLPVIGLIQSFSPNNKHANERTPEQPERPTIPSTIEYRAPHVAEYIDETSLGNFEEIWKHLGRPLHIPYPDNSSDSGQNNTKGVRWRDEIDGADLADNDEIDDSKRLAGLTRSQRKKARRKERRTALANALTNGKIVPSSSENESEQDSEKPKIPDRKAIIHELLGRPLPDEDARDGNRVLQRRTHAVKDKLPVGRPHGLNAPHRPSETNAYATAGAKKARLMTMLREQFVGDHQYLNDINFLQHVSSSTTTTDGIHVFIDASNIMIGFHDALKFSRSLPLATRIRRQSISFHSLSLILSRGRPTAKRVIVGSDNFPEMTEAKLIGYETNILDRVHKAKELTPRQKKYAANNGNGTQSAGSGSETTSAIQYAPEKWVEQAVDEILHLKMMESIVDAAEPSIMVLATGDAAEAEYSGGFMKMVERALQKGWKVELASFRRNISGGWKKKEWRQKWGEKFKVIELDDFVEVLLGSD